MYGSSIGKLSVFAIAGTQNTQLVVYTGNQGNTWHLVQAAFSAPQNYQVNTLILPQMFNKWYFNYHLHYQTFGCEVIQSTIAGWHSLQLMVTADVQLSDSLGHQVK